MKGERKISKSIIIYAGEKYMSDIKAERQSPNSVPTPLKKQEPTAAIWKKGGDKSVGDALSGDKNSVRQPVKQQELLYRYR
jgi:hypothetical protein